MTTIPLNRAIGSFLGLAAGDAYGRTLEFVTGLKVRQARVSTDTHDFMWTDDTHMSLYLADALLKVGTQPFSADNLGKAIGKAFALWYQDPLTPSTAPGNTCLAGAKNFMDGQNWKTSGIKSSDGCGAVMRICPLPLVYRGDSLDIAAAVSAQVTHGHPNAIAATVAGSRLLRNVLEKGDINEAMVLKIAEEIELSHPEGTDVSPALRAAVLHTQRENIEWLDEAFIPPGDGGWRSPSALGLGIAAALIWKQNPAKAIEKAARINGDSDSVACITGMLLGAAFGTEALPADWLDAIPMRKDIEQKVKKLLDIKSTSTATSLADKLRSLVKSGAQVLPDPDRLRNAILFGLPYGHSAAEQFDSIATSLGVSVQHGATSKVMAIDPALVPADVRRKLGGKKKEAKANAPDAFSSSGHAVVIEDIPEAEIIVDAEVLGHNNHPVSTPKPGPTRTSISDPISVSWVEQDVGAGNGALGITFAPGKKGASLVGPPWNRDLELDLNRLRGRHHVDALVSLIEDSELELLEIATLVQSAAEHQIAILRFPIVDMSVPTMESARQAVDIALALANAGRRIVFHCRDGLGRAGTLTACTLVKMGMHPQQAIDHTRKHRNGAIENKKQEDFVHRFARVLEQ